MVDGVDPGSFSALEGMLQRGVTVQEMWLVFREVNAWKMADLVGGRQVMKLMGKQGKAGSTTVAWIKEWRGFSEYWRKSGLTGIATGVDIVCFLVWLTEQRLKEERTVSSR